MVEAVAMATTFPAGLCCGFGRFPSIFAIFAHLYSSGPGVLGDYWRIAFYRQTLDACPLDSRISFGSFFSTPRARVGHGVYVGANCILGQVTIGDGTQIASGVQILSGARQHIRDEAGRISGSAEGVFEPVGIGPECWIGAAAVVMADVGEGSTIGAGSVVTKPIPAGVVAVGTPAKVIRSAVAPEA